jgi:hypothetical protein
MKLQKQLTEWRVDQFSRWPALEEQIPSSETVLIEDEPLFLPSSFSEPLRVHLGLEEAAQVEFQLRDGQAHDALEALRLAIKTYNYNISFKKTQVFGQGANTRSQAYLKSLENDKQTEADRYIHARSALLNLGLSPRDPVLRPLDKSTQLFSKNYFASAQLGDSRKSDPWFWNIRRPLAVSQDRPGDSDEEKEWETESTLSSSILYYLVKCSFPNSSLSLSANRVKWFRDSAARDRAVEEKEILEEEFRRAVAYFDKMCSVWTDLGEQPGDRGVSAYAFKQAAVYKKLGGECLNLEKKALLKKDEYDAW